MVEKAGLLRQVLDCSVGGEDHERVEVGSEPVSEAITAQHCLAQRYRDDMFALH